MAFSKEEVFKMAERCKNLDCSCDGCPLQSYSEEATQCMTFLIGLLYDIAAAKPDSSVES